MRDLEVTHLVPAPFGAYGVTGGAERYAFELARAMARRVPTTLVTFGPALTEEHLDGLTVRVLGPARAVRGQRHNPLSRGLLRALRPATIVHCHQQHIVASSLAALYCRLTGRRVFVSDLGGGGWDISAYLSTDRWYHGHLHISEYSRQVAGHDGWERAHVIYGGVDVETFRPAHREPEHARALFVGRLLPHKGVNYLIEGLPEGLGLDIVGREADSRYLRDLRELARGRDVRFIHDAGDADLVRLYQRALCVVLPSVYRTMYGDETRVPELLGQTLLEGMACGMPGLCTDVASLPEVVDDGVTGFVVRANDPDALRNKLEWFRAHRDETRRMGEAARRHVLDRFTWPAVVRRCLDAYSLRDAAEG